MPGCSPETFGPDDPLTREQLATMLYRYAALKEDGFSGSRTFLLAYSDAGQVSCWADEAMHWAVMNGIIQGFGDGTLRPLSGATRAQTATVLWRYLVQ